MKQTYKGHYTYDSEAIQKSIGHERTLFTIEIEFAEDDTFKGSVKDDVFTGGMNGIGEINGEIDKDAIFFMKQMPFECKIDKFGNRINSDRKHLLLIYEGNLSEPNKYIGKWEFEKRWGLILGFIPFKFSPGKGKWEMEKV